MEVGSGTATLAVSDECIFTLIMFLLKSSPNMVLD